MLFGMSKVKPSTFPRRAKKKRPHIGRIRGLENDAIKRLLTPQYILDLQDAPDELQVERNKRNPRYNASAVRCSRCREWKVSNEFTPQKNRHNQPHGYCKECRREMARERRFIAHKHRSGAV